MDGQDFSQSAAKNLKTASHKVLKKARKRTSTPAKTKGKRRRKNINYSSAIYDEAE